MKKLLKEILKKSDTIEEVSIVEEPFIDRNSIAKEDIARAFANAVANDNSLDSNIKFYDEENGLATFNVKFVPSIDSPLNYDLGQEYEKAVKGSKALRSVKQRLKENNIKTDGQPEVLARKGYIRGQNGNKIIDIDIPIKFKR